MVCKFFHNGYKLSDSTLKPPALIIPRAVIKATAKKEVTLKFLSFNSALITINCKKFSTVALHSVTEGMTVIIIRN